MKQKQVTHRQIIITLKELMNAKRLEYPNIGYIYYADVKGDSAKYKPQFYAVINGNGGVSGVNHIYKKETMRKTLEHLQTLTKEVKGK